MSSLDAERIAVERLDEGVSNLVAIRDWQRNTDAIRKTPLERLALTRKIDQARARGDNPLIDELVAEITALDEYVKALEERNLHLENERGVDGLTGVANRARLDAQLRSEWRRCSRIKDTLGLIFVDLDEFKGINDTHGHRAGDALLVGVGEQLQRTMRRAGDFVGRYGGDEFVVLLPATDVHEAAGVAQRIQSALRSMEVQYGKLVLRAAASIGVAAAQPYKSGASVEHLLESADRALYAAKNLQRNCIVAAVEEQGEIQFARVEPLEEEVQAQKAHARAARR